MTDVVMPKWGLTMEEGTVVAWLKQPGDAVTTGDLLCEVETDKATGEVESPAPGVLGEIVAGPDTAVAVGAVIARIYTAEEWERRNHDW